jgi:hypothetical protein
LQPGTLAAELLHASTRSEAPYKTTLTVANRVPLEGEELEAYEAAAAAALAAGAGEGGQLIAGADGLMPLRSSSMMISKLVKGTSGGVMQVRRVLGLRFSSMGEFADMPRRPHI